jgi:hypothetical protein
MTPAMTMLMAVLPATGERNSNRLRPDGVEILGPDRTDLWPGAPTAS